MSRTASRPRRTQAERSEATTNQLVSTARDLFARQGYAGTSLEAVCEKAGVTKGALYHHFDNKTALFEAVFRAEHEKLLARLAAAALEKDDPWDGFLAGATTYLDACLDPAVRRITLLDASAVLGWERMREIESDYGLAMLKQGLRQAARAGRIRRRDVDGVAHLLFGALGEGAMYIAQQPDQKAALRRVSRDLKSLLDGITTQD